MELSAYTEALSLHYYETMGGAIEQPPYRTWIFTDSEYTSKAGAGECVRRANRDLWAIVDWYEAAGYQLSWRWVPRNSTPFHERADFLAGQARKAVGPLAMSDEELYDMLPAGSMPRQVADVALAQCPSCQTPMLAHEPECPTCGHQMIEEDT